MSLRIFRCPWHRCASWCVGRCKCCRRFTQFLSKVTPKIIFFPSWEKKLDKRIPDTFYLILNTRWLIGVHHSENVCSVPRTGKNNRCVGSVTYKIAKFYYVTHRSCIKVSDKTLTQLILFMWRFIRCLCSAVQMAGWGVPVKPGYATAGKIRLSTRSCTWKAAAVRWGWNTSDSCRCHVLCGSHRLGGDAGRVRLPDLSDGAQWWNNLNMNSSSSGQTHDHISCRHFCEFSRVVFIFTIRYKHVLYRHPGSIYF